MFFIYQGKLRKVKIRVRWFRIIVLKDKDEYDWCHVTLNSAYFCQYLV
jgi:hypothetical protein